jgi:hypothetical protein
MSSMMGTVLSLVDLVNEGDTGFLGHDNPGIISGASSDSNNCGSSDSRGC